MICICTIILGNEKLFFLRGGIKKFFTDNNQSKDNNEAKILNNKNSNVKKIYADIENSNSEKITRKQQVFNSFEYNVQTQIIPDELNNTNSKEKIYDLEDNVRKEN